MPGLHTLNLREGAMSVRVHALSLDIARKDGFPRVLNGGLSDACVMEKYCACALQCAHERQHLPPSLQVGTALQHLRPSNSAQLHSASALEVVPLPYHLEKAVIDR